MPENDTWLKSFFYVWNVSSGVYNDKNSKISRLVFFALILAAIVFIMFMFYRALTPAELLKKTDIRLSPERIISDRNAMLELFNKSEVIAQNKISSDALAASMSDMNRRLFTEDLANITNANLTDGIINSETDESITLPDEKLETNIQNDKPDVKIHGILISKKNNQAVIEVNGKKGIIVKAGTSIPEANARIISVNSKGLKLRANGKVFDYLLINAE